MTRALLLMTLCAAPLAAQTPRTADVQRASSDGYAVAATIGLHLATTPYGIGPSASLSASRKVLSLRLGYDAASNLKGSLTMNAVSASLGVNTRVGRMTYAAFAGPAMMWGLDGLDERGFAVGDERYSTIGAIAGVSALFGSRLQFGVGAWGIANSRRVTVAVGPRLSVSSR